MTEPRSDGNDAGRGERTQEIIDSLFFPFYVVDAQSYRIEIINEAARRGRDVGETTCHLLTHQSPAPCDSEEHGCPLKEVTRTGKRATMVHTHFTEDGEPRLFRVHGVPIKDGSGQVVKMIEYSIDITDQTRAEEESRRAMTALEEANATKEELIHQLSTPVIEVGDGILVAPIIGFVDSERGSEIMRALLGACSDIQARGVIIDITGIEVMDESTAAQLVRMSKAIQLLGTTPVISGVSPAVAHTMISSDVALKSIKTVRSLKDGLQWFLPGGRGGLASGSLPAEPEI
jgi:anti-anti-sigma regulatory factor